MMAANRNEPEARTRDPREKITTGANDRPVDASIGQSAGGLPDDSGGIVEVDEAEAKRIEKALTER